jgi:hypothetical protein
MAGAGGSGKGFIIDNLLGIEGKVFDVDKLKELFTKTAIFKKYLDDNHIDINSITDLRNPENVSRLHNIIDSMKISDKQQYSFFKNIIETGKKPNIIFDVTLKNITKLNNISRMLLDAGYQKENIHIVWVLNSVDVAIEQNTKRDRVVPIDILIDAHEGVSLTMNKLLQMGDNLNQYMDGDIWLCFNQIHVDSEMIHSKSGGKYIKGANYIKLKEKNKKSLSLNEIDEEILDKINSYIPQFTYKWKK